MYMYYIYLYTVGVKISALTMCTAEVGGASTVLHRTEPNIYVFAKRVLESWKGEPK